MDTYATRFNQVMQFARQQYVRNGGADEAWLESDDCFRAKLRAESEATDAVERFNRRNLGTLAESLLLKRERAYRGNRGNRVERQLLDVRA
nr:hypothetical protein [uncultured Rhodopila sp.]